MACTSWHDVQERKKLKRGGGEDSSARRESHDVVAVDLSLGEALVPGRVVVDDEDHLVSCIVLPGACTRVRLHSCTLSYENMLWLTVTWCCLRSH